MKRISVPTRIGAAFLLAPAVLVLAGGPALAADNVLVSNLETIQAHLNADGTVQDARIYEQIALQGKGTVTIDNPVSTDNLRNLDGFGGFEVKGGKMVSTQTVDGESRLRAVSDYGKTLPLKVTVTYKLDGKTVEAGDVVGRSGRLDVHYKVENVTGKSQDVTFDDGTGKKVTQSEKVVIPMVGSLTTVLPASFVDVSSGEANMAGDGHGQTKMSFTMTLFGPIGSPTSEFGYSAEITGGLIPDATISALPVSPLDSPSFKGGAASYKSGADTGVQLTAGATEIDANVLKLRDGAQTLLAGLIQLRAGAQELNTGLADKAAPGAVKLADGASLLKDGAGQLKDGLDQASSEAPALLDGLVQVADGLELVDGGLVKLYGGIGELPAKATPLHDGIQQMVAGLGDKTTTGTLIYGVNAVRSALAEATKSGGSLDQLKGGVDGSKAGVDAVKAALNAALATGGDIDLLKGGAAAAQASAGCQTDPVCVGTLAAVINSIDVTLRNSTQTGSTALAQVSGGLGVVSPGLATLKAGLDTHAPGTFGPTDPGGAGYGLAIIECGLSNATLPGVCDPDRPGLLQGLGSVDDGVSQLVGGVVSQVRGAVGKAADVAPDQKTLRGGVHAVMGGIDLIGEGGLTLLDGLDQLSTGAHQLSDGTVELSDGANQLRSGLTDAATGSGKLADGLTTAADGGKALPEGASRLSAEGTSKLVDAGRSTASDYGLKYALIVAGAERAKTEGMAYGAPANAGGTTAYSLEISGADGDGGTSIGRGVGALALFGAGSGLALFRRRSV